MRIRDSFPRLIHRSLMLLVLSLVLVGLASSASAQIPQPSGPVTFCAQRATPIGDSYTASVDDGAPQAITFGTDARCPASHPASFTLAGAQFTLRAAPYLIRVTGTNAFGSTTGPQFSLQIGAAPGLVTIGGVLPPSE